MKPTAPPNLSGFELPIEPASTTVTIQEAATVIETAAHGRRKQSLWWPEDTGVLLPVKRLRHQVSISYTHLRELGPKVQRLLAEPEPYQLTTWIPIDLCYLSDGVTAEGWWPWQEAADVVATPSAQPASRFIREIRLGVDGEPLSLEVVDAAAFAATSPSEGEALWSGQSFKVVPPVAGERIYVRGFPLLEVVTSPESRETYQARTLGLEPLTVDFLEVG